MGAVRVLGHGAVAAALWLWIAQSAFADGLSRFEQLIKPQLPPAIKALGLTVSYAGTRPHAAAAPPVALPAAASAAPPGTPAAGCTPGVRYFVFHEDAWWAATVRDATQSGNQCIVRIEGSTDDIVVTLDKTMAWSIDGPGKAVDKCNPGDRVLVESDGGWYPGKIANQPAAAGKCPIKFDSPDNDDETVELKRVRRPD
jgi:hypothetical protein